jgi:hypothetical protein
MLTPKQSADGSVLMVWFVFRAGRIEFGPDCQIDLLNWTGGPPRVGRHIRVGSTRYKVTNCFMDGEDPCVDVVITARGLTRRARLADLRRRHDALKRELTRLEAAGVVVIGLWDDAPGF